MGALPGGRGRRGGKRESRGKSRLITRVVQAGCCPWRLTCEKGVEPVEGRTHHKLGNCERISRGPARKNNALLVAVGTQENSTNHTLGPNVEPLNIAAGQQESGGGQSTGRDRGKKKKSPCCNESKKRNRHSQRNVANVAKNFEAKQP